MSEWITPKTDWTENDFFNVSDYNRIKNNIQFLAELGKSLFYPFPQIESAEDKVVGDIPYASEINKLVSDLEAVNSSSYALDIGESIFYRPNGKTPLYTDYNRIESASARLHDLMAIHKDSLAKMPFRLGNQKGLRV